MIVFIDQIIYFFAYTGILIGSWFLIYPFIYSFIIKRKVSRRIRSYQIDKSSVKPNKYKKHIEMLLSVTLNNNSIYTILTFYIVSVILMLTSFLFLFKISGLLFNIIFSIIIGFLPYILLQLKLHNIRINSSYEAEKLVLALINQYKINYLNMIEAIDKTIPEISDLPYSKRALFRLSLAVKQYKNQDELQQIIKEFNFSINTAWSVLLANNLFLSIHYGDDVREALDDILEELIELKNINEKNKQFNHESFLMIKYITPITYLLSVYAMFSIFGFTTQKFIEYQLKNDLGFKFFLLTLGFICLNYLVYFFIKKPKNDF